MIFIALLLTFVGSALAGSACPPRENIYPCSCVAVPQGRNIYFTSVTCHRLTSTDALADILPALRTMTIEHLYLYDSFWDADKLGNNGDDKQKLPGDWLTMLKVKEMEIVDTTLSHCFACNFKMNCRNSITTRFTAVNSSSHEKICGLCEGRDGKKFSWTSCMSKLREFHFRNGKLISMKPDLFPLPMLQLTVVDLSHNNIMNIEKNALKNLPNLKTLKLSHNALETLEGIASAKLEQLQELDVSWNMISSLGQNFFAALPKIKTFLASNNELRNLVEGEWKNPPITLRVIDLRENAIHCDCNIRWINNTFHINTVIQGHCATPEDYENSLIRKASRMLIERCTEDGKIGTRKRITKALPTKAMFVPV